MVVRVRNLQPEGGSALPVGKYKVAPGFTSPPVEVSEGTPLEEVINSWIEDGIAMVLPDEDAGGTTGMAHKPARKAKILDLSQAKALADKRLEMRRTSLDLSTLQPPVPTERRSGTNTRILSLDQVKGRSRIEVPVPKVPGVEIPGIQEETAPVMAEPIPKAVEPVVPELPKQPDLVPEEDLDEEDRELAAEAQRNEKLAHYEDTLTQHTKAALLEKATGLGLDVNPAMLKANIVSALAFYAVENNATDSFFN